MRFRIVSSATNWTHNHSLSAFLCTETELPLSVTTVEWPRAPMTSAFASVGLRMLNDIEGEALRFPHGNHILSSGKMIKFEAYATTTAGPERWKMDGGGREQRRTHTHAAYPGDGLRPSYLISCLIGLSAV